MKDKYSTTNNTKTVFGTGEQRASCPPDSARAHSKHRDTEMLPWPIPEHLAARPSAPGACGGRAGSGELTCWSFNSATHGIT